jgi:sugar/nucleoside kinase (ribokinase family)
MPDFIYDVTGIGNAIVDILAHVEDDFLVRYKLERKSMVLIDESTAAVMYNNMPPAVQISGGSVANTIAGLASFGAKVAFMGKVYQDILGEVFSHDLLAMGVHYPVPFATSGPKTARSFIAVTPDAERTMATYLGAARHMTVDDINTKVITQSRVLYLEGYLWDEAKSKEAIRYAIKVAESAGCKVALTLSDVFCVERYRSEFLELIDGHVDILFANEAEIKCLFEESNLDIIIQQLQGRCDISAVTLGSKGSWIIADKPYAVPPFSDMTVIDTTGAGDLYASGLLYGYVRGFDIPKCGELASLAAAEVISHIGARPQVSLAALASTSGITGQVA